MNNCAFWIWALGQLFVSVWQRLRQRHPAGTWAIHPKSCWIEVQNTYYMTQTSCNWGNMNLTVSIIWMTPSKASFCDFPLKLPLLTVVCYLEAIKNKRSSRTWLVHPSSPHLWLRWKFFEKIRNICLHHLAALSSCNTRFEGEKWELSQLEHSGELQLFQKILTWKKHMWMLFWQEKHTQNTGKHTSHQYLSRMYHFWQFQTIKHNWAIFRFMINHQHSESQEKTYLDAL